MIFRSQLLVWDKKKKEPSFDSTDCESTTVTLDKQGNQPDRGRELTLSSSVWFEFCLSEGCSIFWGLIQAQRKAKGRRKPLSFAFASVLAHSFTRKWASLAWARSAADEWRVLAVPALGPFIEVFYDGIRCFKRRIWIEETCHRIDVSIEAIKIESVKG